ncbi:MAG: fatty acid-binding protein DegV, partial [Oscillospiraceae bacterium]|nr:fatty acid-binding protein DegV [Oscillospiraceae bacterium]
MSSVQMKGLLFSDEHSQQDRLFILITAMTLITWAVKLAEIIVASAPVHHILFLFFSMILIAGITVQAIRTGRGRLGAAAVAFLVCLVYTPNVFFHDGGICGEAPVWFLFSVFFIGTCLSGKTMVLYLMLELAEAVGCWYCSWRFPSLIIHDSELTVHIFSLIALILTGVTVSITIGYRNMLYRASVQRSIRQTKEIEALNEAQNHFFSSMSHEIRTPINTIFALNEMILRENINDEVAEDAANIQSASKMLLHLINDILDMSKFASGKMKLTPVVYNPGDMLSEIVGMLWIRAKEKGLDFQVHVSPDIPVELLGDEVRIKQILINVLNNAIKYTPQGSVSLTIQPGETENGILHVIYSVSDTGIGIKKENIPYLFSAFKRMDEEKNRHIEGTGLGLSIVRQFVDLMGGK